MNKVLVLMLLLLAGSALISQEQIPCDELLDKIKTDYLHNGEYYLTSDATSINQIILYRDHSNDEVYLKTSRHGNFDYILYCKIPEVEWKSFRLHLRKKHIQGAFNKYIKRYKCNCLDQ